MRRAPFFLVVGLVAALALGACTRRGAGQVEAPNVELAEPEREDRHRRTVGDSSLVAYCDPGLSRQVEVLFDIVEQMHREGAELRAGFRVSAGWTTLILAAEGKSLVFQEPDYDADNPESAMRDDISASVRMLSEQTEVLARIGMQGEDVNFDEHVLLTKGALELDKVYLVRVASPGGRVTGWRIAATEDQEGEMEVDSIPLYEVFKRRPALVRAMLLPVGFMVFYDGDRIDVIVDPNDEPVWERVQEV